MKHSIKTGLFIGVTAASMSALALRIAPGYWTLVAFLYLFPVVGALTAYFVHKKMRIKIEERLEEI